MNKSNDLTTLKKVSLNITRVLSILGLAGLFDNIITWHGFLGDIVDVYSQVRDQVINWIFGWWLWVEFPVYLADILILYGCMVLASRMLMIGLEEAMGYGRFGGLLHSLIIPPQLLFVSLLFEFKRYKNIKTGRWATRSGLDDYFNLRDIRYLSKLFLKYLAYIFGAFVILLMLNWQILQRFS